MKIVYIGTGDALAEVLAERIGQEGHDVYLLSDKAIPKKPKASPCTAFTGLRAKGRASGNFCAPSRRTA